MKATLLLKEIGIEILIKGVTQISPILLEIVLGVTELELSGTQWRITSRLQKAEFRGKTNLHTPAKSLIENKQIRNSHFHLSFDQFCI